MITPPLYYPQLPSTQDEAKRLILGGDTTASGVRAGHQTAGRGRRGARWIAPPNTCLLVTYILRGDDCDIEVANRLAFVAALAVADPLTCLDPRFKWPNDVYVQASKVCGILVEVAPDALGDMVALVGIGVNVNVAAFPADLTTPATSLQIASGREWDIEALEEQVRTALTRERQILNEQGFGATLERWRMRDATPGVRFYLEDGSQGVAQGVADNGALLLRNAAGEVCQVFGATSGGW